MTGAPRRGRPSGAAAGPEAGVGDRDPAGDRDRAGGRGDVGTEALAGSSGDVAPEAGVADDGRAGDRDPAGGGGRGGDGARAPLLAVHGLTVVHGAVTAVDDVDLTVLEGEVAGLIGPNGAGKTTFIDAVAGFVAPRRGRVVLGGRDVGGLGPHERVRAGLARTFQGCQLFPDLTVRENLTVAAHRPARWSWVLDALAPRRATAATGVDELLDRLGLAAVAGARPHELPHGVQRLADLGRALASRPRVVLLDEPAAGLDGDETAGLGEVIRGLPELGVAVLLVDHDMGLVMRSCARVHVLDLGRVIAVGTPAAVRADPAVVAAYLGQAAATTGSTGGTGAHHDGAGSAP